MTNQSSRCQGVTLVKKRRSMKNQTSRCQDVTFLYRKKKKIYEESDQQMSRCDIFMEEKKKINRIRAVDVKMSHFYGEKRSMKNQSSRCQGVTFLQRALTFHFAFQSSQKVKQGTEESQKCVFTTSD